MAPEEFKGTGLKIAQIIPALQIRTMSEARGLVD